MPCNKPDNVKRASLYCEKGLFRLMQVQHHPAGRWPTHSILSLTYLWEVNSGRRNSLPRSKTRNQSHWFRTSWNIFLMCLHIFADYMDNILKKSFLTSKRSHLVGRSGCFGHFFKAGNPCLASASDTLSFQVDIYPFPAISLQYDESDSSTEQGTKSKKVLRVVEVGVEQWITHRTFSEGESQQILPKCFYVQTHPNYECLFHRVNT